MEKDMEELVEPDMMSFIVGAGERRIWLHNNPSAENPTWEELVEFLQDDKTDQHSYDRESFVCADFAEMLHNNAERAGIRAAFVALRLDHSLYNPLGEGHAVNAFKTTDRGLVYIDCTGSNQGISADKIVVVEVGREYAPRSIFPEPGWASNWDNLGTIREITIKW